MVASKPRSRRPIAETPPSTSATSVQALLGPPSGFAAPLPGTLNDPGALRSHSRCHGHLLQTPPHPFQALTTPSPRRPRLPKPPDPAPADLARLLTPPRMPPSIASGIILGGLNPPGGLRGRSRWRLSMLQTPRPPFRVPWIPSTKVETTFSGALKPIIAPTASQAPGYPGVRPSEGLEFPWDSRDKKILQKFCWKVPGLRLLCPSPPGTSAGRVCPLGALNGGRPQPVPRLGALVFQGGFSSWLFVT
jgi:hypothetical protein